MKTLLWICALLLNVGGIVIGVTFACVPDVPLVARLVAAVLGVCAAGLSLLLVLARAKRVPAWGSSVMRALCCAVPVGWLVGSLDHGLLSGQELLSLLLVVVVYWGTWRVFQSVSKVVV